MSLTRGWLSTAMILFLTHNMASTHREHKVHNIVLYPDKHSWCKTTAIKQVVAYPGCESVEIDNNVCVGACFSYSIPRTMPSAPGELIKPYCDSCQPSSVVWQHVTLTCNSEEDIFERVQMIENCSCSACFTGEDTGEHQLESSGDGDVYKPASGDNKPASVDVPELMDLMMETHNTRKNHNESLNRTVTKEDPALNERLLLLLKHISEDTDLLETNLDKIALKELLRRVEGADHRVNQVRLAELINWIEDTEHILVDLPKLKHILGRFAHDESEKHHEPEVPIHHEVHRHHSHHHHHHPVENHHHHHYHEEHTGDVDETEKKEEEREGIVPPSGPVISHQKSQDGVDPTLDVAPHHLKPALEGTELSYHENLLDDKHDKSETEN